MRRQLALWSGETAGRTTCLTLEKGSTPQGDRAAVTLSILKTKYAFGCSRLTQH